MVKKSECVTKEIIKEVTKENTHSYIKLLKQTKLTEGVEIEISSNKVGESTKDLETIALRLLKEVK